MPSVMLTNGTFGVSCGLVRFSFVAKVVTKFIPPMLCERLTNVSRLADRGYIAEPKLDGRRAQLHVHEGRAVACYSRRGLDLLEHAGMAWLVDTGGQSTQGGSRARQAPAHTRSPCLIRSDSDPSSLPGYA